MKVILDMMEVIVEGVHGGGSGYRGRGYSGGSGYVDVGCDVGHSEGGSRYGCGGYGGGREGNGGGRGGNGGGRGGYGCGHVGVGNRKLK